VSGDPARRRTGGLAAPPFPLGKCAVIPAGADQSPRKLLGAPLTLATGLAAATPVIVSTVRAVLDGWMPAGDQAIIATRAYDVLSAHTPLVGQYSLTTRVTGQLTYSPGPLLYWLLALPARIGSPTAMAVTVGVANALAIVAIVVLARRRGGALFMFATALAVVLMTRSFMPEALHDTWNPSAGLFPFALLLFCCWSLACGEYRLLVLTALVASFAVQCELTFLAPSLGALAVGVGGLTLSRARRPRRMWPWALAAVLVLVACWSAPLLDELEHSPGNLTLLARAATTRHPTLGASAGRRALVRAIGVPPRWLRRPGDPFDTRLSDVLSEPSSRAAISTIVLLAALALVVALARWHRRWDLAAGAAIGLWLAAALDAVAAKTPLVAYKVLGYTLWWGSVAGMWVWLILALSAAVLARRLFTALVQARRTPLAGSPPPSPAVGASPAPPPAPVHRARERARVSARAGAPLLALAALFAFAGAIGAAQAHDAHYPEYAPLRALMAAVDRSGPHGGTVWVHGALEPIVEPLRPAVTYFLRRRGVHTIATGANDRLGPWYALDHRRYDEQIRYYDSERPPPRGFVLLARVAVLHEGRAHPLSVVIGARAARTP
jgi:hypothetical protein